VLQCTLTEVSKHEKHPQPWCDSVVCCIMVCCIMLQCFADVFQCVAMCCSVLRICCNVLQIVVNVVKDTYQYISDMHGTVIESYRNYLTYVMLYYIQYIATRMSLV